MKRLTGLLLLFVVSLASCKKETFITSPDAAISFSADTLFYDTVFTSVGSITKFVRIFNNNDQKLLISAVELSGGAGSPFHINVDGLPGNASNVEILPNDSLYVFVSVNVNPGSQNLPFLLNDSIRLRYNGTERFVQLQAYGQNAIFLRNHAVTGNEVFTSEKPYVIVGGLLVDKNAVLSIEEGARLYFHANAPLLVDGTLVVNGGKEDSLRVRFQGDRLDDPYRNFPGAWPGIYLRETSTNNILRFAVISNAFQGIVVDQPPSNAMPKLVLNETIVQNCFDAGVVGIRSSIISTNTLISNCGKNLLLAFGGKYQFTHLTDVAYTNTFIAHKDPVLSVTNAYEDGGAVLAADLDASFINSIFWGDDGLVKDEVIVNKQGTSPFAVTFENSLWKISSIPAAATATNMISNQDPLFILVDSDKKNYDFHLKETSPLLGKGRNTVVTSDLDGRPRKSIPDPGAFERP
jgi:hypothetical protein